MSIEFECDECFKKYRVKDEHAGRRLRCKGCGSGLRVPASDVEDEVWDSTDFGDYEDEEEFAPSRPPRKKKSKSKPKKRRKSRRSDSMPTTVIVAEIILAIISIISVLDIIGYLMVENFQRLTGAGIRLMVLVSVFVGLLNRSNNARRSGVAICILGLLLQPFVLFALINGRLPGGEILMAMVVFVMCLIVVLLISLLSPSARDYCSE
ncbi:MAG: hypothetical protein HON04_02350 [Planctomicrobium sp.]|jgi:hypothetical protein|nr:hypothetical protein [Planctomicrobium sp.]